MTKTYKKSMMHALCVVMVSVFLCGNGFGTITILPEEKEPQEKIVQIDGIDYYFVESSDKEWVEAFDSNTNMDISTANSKGDLYCSHSKEQLLERLESFNKTSWLSIIGIIALCFLGVIVVLFLVLLKKDRQKPFPLG